MGWVSRIAVKRAAPAFLAAMTVIHVVGPVIYKWDERAADGRAGCYYLGVAAVNNIELHGKPSGICVTKQVYDATPWLSWFDGNGNARWT